MALTSVVLGDLVLDFGIYPRSQVSSTHVGNLVDVLEAGGQFTTNITVDKKSKRVVDGFHRVRAYRQVLEPTAEIKADLVGFKNEQEVIRAAIRRCVPRQTHDVRFPAA